MKIVSGYYVYRAYVTYKAHFSASNTDISKYGFRVFNCSYETFMNTKGHKFFDKIAKVCKTEKNVASLFIAAFLDDPNLWIGNIVMELKKYQRLAENRENIINNMAYLFAKDCKHLLESGMKFDDDLGAFVFDCLMRSEIELESFIIIKKILKFNLDNDPTYAYIYRVKYEKYEYLVKVDIEKYKSILKEVIMHNRD